MESRSRRFGVFLLFVLVRRAVFRFKERQHRGQSGKQSVPAQIPPPIASAGSCAAMSPRRTNVSRETPRCIAATFQKNPFRAATSRTCASKSATQTGLRKNRRNTSLFIKLSGSYKTLWKSFACLFHVKRFQTGHSARKVLFGRGAVGCNAQRTPVFHVKRFAELRHLADTRKCRTLPLFRRAPSFARLRPNAHAVNCFT